jgi:hypothetical protein
MMLGPTDRNSIPEKGELLDIVCLLSKALSRSWAEEGVTCDVATNERKTAPSIKKKVMRMGVK